MIKIKAIGGYSKIGKNMTAIYIDDEIVITDMGADMEKLVELQDENVNVSTKDKELLIERGAIPNDIDFFEKNRNKVKAIVITHGHLDHIWAVPFLASKYNCPVIATPFTIKVIEHLMSDFNVRYNRIIKLNTGTKYKISDNLVVELVNITHSIPNSSMIAIHTKYGVIMYANDWKLDNTPTLGSPPDYRRMNELRKEGIFALISDSTRVDRDGYCFSESIVKSMLEDVITRNQENRTIFVTTFASHIARLRNINQTARHLRRSVFIFGRSMDMYINAAVSSGIISRDTLPKVITRREDINRALRLVRENPSKYLIICTGHQGEKDSFLDKLSSGAYNYKLSSEDGIIFSSETIPTPVNIANKMALLKKLEVSGARIADNVHVSGHAYKNDLRTFLKILSPKHFIPSHGGVDKISAAINVSNEFGYELNKTSHILLDGQELELL